MTEVMPIAATGEASAIDFKRHFIREEFTPLFHTPIYATLPAAARLRYNQLHALYFNEQVAFFEQEMLSPSLCALMGVRLPAPLSAALKEFHREEQRHTEMFRALNRRCAPELYQRSVSHFVKVGAPTRWLLAQMARQPRVFPLLIWLALLQEERSLYYSKGCVAAAAELEPHFVALHRAHLADEIGHVRWDEELLDWLWPRTSPAVRAMNARLLNWMLGEFFLLPKRSGRCVVEHLAAEDPRLDLWALRRALAGLNHNATYPCMLYSREITPRAFARFDALSEFALLARTLPGYRPAGSP